MCRQDVWCEQWPRACGRSDVRLCVSSARKKTFHFKTATAGEQPATVIFHILEHGSVIERQRFVNVGWIDFWGRKNDSASHSLSIFRNAWDKGCLSALCCILIVSKGDFLTLVPLKKYTCIDCIDLNCKQTHSSFLWRRLNTTKTVTYMLNLPRVCILRSGMDMLLATCWPCVSSLTPRK